MLMGGMFDVAFRRFAAAFEARADQVYGATLESGLGLPSASSVSIASASQHRQPPHLGAADVAEAPLAMIERAAPRGRGEMHEADRLLRPSRRPARRCR